MAAPTPEALPGALAAALNSGDLAAALELWAEDAIIVQPDGGSVRGRGAVEEALRGMIGHGVAFGIEVADIYVAGDVAVVRGTLTLSGEQPGGGRFAHSSDAIVVYTRSREGWRVAVDAPWGFPDGSPTAPGG